MVRKVYLIRTSDGKADVLVLETSACNGRASSNLALCTKLEIKMLIKMLTGYFKDCILYVSVDELRLGTLDDQIEFIVRESTDKDLIGKKFNMTDDLGEHVLFESYKKI